MKLGVIVLDIFKIIDKGFTIKFNLTLIWASSSSVVDADHHHGHHFLSRSSLSLFIALLRFCFSTVCLRVMCLRV